MAKAVEWSEGAVALVCTSVGRGVEVMRDSVASGLPTTWVTAVAESRDGTEVWVSLVDSSVVGQRDRAGLPDVAVRHTLPNPVLSTAEFSGGMSELLNDLLYLVLELEGRSAHPLVAGELEEAACAVRRAIALNS